jgi:hypothetical protein
MRRAFAAIACLSVLLYAELAVACPVCASRDESGGVMRTVALGVLVVAPWIIALTVGLYIRRDIRRSLVPAAVADSETTE